MTLKRWLLFGVLGLVAMFYLMPVYVMAITGLKPFTEVSVRQMWDLPTGLYFGSFVDAYVRLAPNLWNSLRLVVPGTILSALWGSINGYVLSKWRFRGSEIVFGVLLFGMFIPYQSVLIPLVQTLQKMQLYGSINGLILVHIIFGIPITTLIFRNYYDSLPPELLEAARVDGAGVLGSYRHIILPLSIPGFVVVIIWQFTSIWNEFLFAVTLTSNPNAMPVTVALQNMAGTQVVEWNVQMAGALIAAIPTLLVYIVAGRYFLRGLTAGSLAGQ